jgi:hypothetical protein
MSTTTDQTRRINLLVERLVHEPALRERYGREPSAVLAETGIEAVHGAALASGDMAALTQIGMHPILQMHYQMILKPQMAAHMTIRHYPDLLEGC